MTRLASTNRTPSVTARRSTSALDDAPSTTMTTIAYANVARNKPKASFVTLDRTNVRITRGDSWELANCKATRVIVKTTPTKVSIDAAMMPRSASAEPALTGRPPPTFASPGIESALETATPTAIPTTQQRSWNNPKPFMKPLLREHKPESIPGFRPQRLHRCREHDRPISLIRVKTRSLHTANSDTKHNAFGKTSPESGEVVHAPL